MFCRGSGICWPMVAVPEVDEADTAENNTGAFDADELAIAGEPATTGESATAGELATG